MSCQHTGSHLRTIKLFQSNYCRLSDNVIVNVFPAWLARGYWAFFKFVDITKQSLTSQKIVVEKIKVQYYVKSGDDMPARNVSLQTRDTTPQGVLAHSTGIPQIKVTQVYKTNYVLANCNNGNLIFSPNILAHDHAPLCQVWLQKTEQFRSHPPDKGFNMKGQTA